MQDERKQPRIRGLQGDVPAIVSGHGARSKLASSRRYSAVGDRILVYASPAWVSSVCFKPQLQNSRPWARNLKTDDCWMATKRPEDVRQSAAELLALLVRDRRHRIDDGTISATHQRHFRELCSLLLWKHSEAFGKYRGCRYWSLGALASRKTHGGVVTNRARRGGEALRHEHLFPRKQLIDKLFSLDDPTRRRSAGSSTILTSAS